MLHVSKTCSLKFCLCSCIMYLEREIDRERERQTEREYYSTAAILFVQKYL